MIVTGEPVAGKVAEPGHGRALRLEARARLSELVALRDHLLGDGLMANLELPEMGGLRRDGALRAGDRAL